MMSEPKPLIYPFENPSLTVGLAAINATEPPFTVEPKHLTVWFREGKIALYRLVDEIRELWNREGLGDLFDLLFGEAKGCTLIAHQWGEREWSRTEGSEIASYGIYGIDTAEALYLEDCKESPHSARHHDDKSTRDIYHATGEFPLPEPVLPRYEAQKIYTMAHGISESESPTKEQKSRVTANQSKVIVELLASHGFTDADFQGSIAALQQKVARKGLSPTFSSVTEKPVAEWFKKGGKR